MKITFRRVVCLIMALCLISAMTTAYARSSLTLDAYSAGCVAESGGKIAIWIDVIGSFNASDREVVEELEKRKPHLNDHDVNMVAYQLVEGLFS